LIDLNLGDNVVFTAEYNGYPRGTKGIFLEYTHSSGYHVPVIVIPDERLQETLDLSDTKSLKELVEKRSVRGRPDNYLLKAYLTIVMPYKDMVTTKEVVESNLLCAERMLAQAKSDLQLFD
jgi:hypothetical protein